MVQNKRLEKEQITTASIKKLISVLQSGAINYEQYQQELQMQLDKMSEANKAYLSQYVTHRKVVLELLRFVLQSENFGKYNKEEYLHNLIYSNLWLIDERLAYADYIAVENPFNGAIKKSGPNIVMPDHPVAVSDESNTGRAYETITILELDSVMRDDYTKTENPITQIKKMEIKWEKMDYIAFILLGMLTIFYGNKQLQQLVAGLYIALAIWYVYTIIYEVKRYRQQKKDINSFAECLENVKKVQRIPDDIEMQKIGSGLVTFPSNFDGTFYAIKIRAGEFIAVHEKLYCMLTESSNIILLQAKSPIAAYELAVGESMIIDNRKLAAASSSLICEGKFLQTLYQMLGIRKRYEEKIIGPGRLWLTDTPIKEEES